MTEVATLRWGDTHSFEINPANLGDLVPSKGRPSKQLVSANWHVPMSWNVILVAQPNFSASETSTFTVQWLVTLGCGQATISNVPLFTMTLAPAAGVYTTQQSQQLVPSQNLQIICKITSSPAPATTTDEQLLVAAMVAPNNAEVFAELDALRAMRQHTEQVRWSGSGPDRMAFADEALAYQDYRRR